MERQEMVPWQRPRELSKKPYGLPLIKIEKQAMEKQQDIHFLDLEPKPRKFMR